MVRINYNRGVSISGRKGREVSREVGSLSVCYWRTHNIPRLDILGYKLGVADFESANPGLLGCADAASVADEGRLFVDMMIEMNPGFSCEVTHF